jgi:hypothetical protein
MTKTIVEFVCYLQSLGITLEADENRLREIGRAHV